MMRQKQDKNFTMHVQSQVPEIRVLLQNEFKQLWHRLRIGGCTIVQATQAHNQAEFNNGHNY